MRILQIIDSLEVGGAEKMAVNFAKSLSTEIEFSGIVVTRKEGILKKELINKNNYFFLEKVKTFDFKALYKLKHICKKNKIEYLQVHGTSFFIAVLLKLIYSKVKILWHDHSGARAKETIFNNKILWLFSFFFSGIIVVNNELESWAKKNLNCKKIIYLPNFTTIKNNEKVETILLGNDDKKIVILANLRNPKNHLLLIEVAKLSVKKFPDWSFHFIGKDNNDRYSDKLKLEIKLNNLENTIFLYGQKNDTSAILSQATICVLCSLSEGLPVSILEYGLFKKPVISTNVGQINLIIKHNENGFLVESNNVKQFYNSLSLLIDNKELRTKFGEKLHQTIHENNSEKIIIKKYLSWINNN